MKIFELLKNIQKTYAYNVFAWLILIDIGIFVYLIPKPLRPLDGPDFDILIMLFIYFGLIYALIKILVPIIVFFIEKKYLKPIENNFIIENKLYLSFTLFSIIIQLMAVIPILAFFVYIYITNFIRGI